MVVTILFIIGFAFLIKGADFLVEGSASIAKKSGISNLVIGLTIVSFGTSSPELVVNVVASIRGSADIALGNIVGSNIANILLILGVSACICTINVKRNTYLFEIPFSLGAGILLFLLANGTLICSDPSAVISRFDGLALLVVFSLFVVYTMRIARKDVTGQENIKVYRLGGSVTMIIAGMLGLYFGGRWIVDGAIVFSKKLGLSESLIGLTVIALGTSLPELAASATAAYKKNPDIAIGNVIGSNIFNVLWVIGLSAVIRPLDFNPVINVDIILSLFITVLLLGFVLIGKKRAVTRRQGICFVVLYAVYIVYLVKRG
jgi:cation:H+ antiporter